MGVTNNRNRWQTSPPLQRGEIRQFTDLKILEGESRCSNIVIRNVTLSIFGSCFSYMVFILREALSLQWQRSGLHPPRLVATMEIQNSFSIDEAKIPGKALTGSG